MYVQQYNVIVEKLKIKKILDDDFMTLAIEGELDASTSIQLDKVIIQAIEDHYYNILVDCKDLKYISSAGLGVFVSHMSDLRSNNGQFVLYQLTKNVYDTFKILGLHDLITITNNAEEAMNFLVHKL